MKPILFPENETAFTSNGLGRLSDAISCNVHQEINGSYELEMVYPVDGIHYEDISEGRFIYCAHDDTGIKQPFEIFEITRPIGGQIEIHAWHISYRLNKITVMPHISGSAQAAVSDLKRYAANECPFEFSTELTSDTDMNVKVPTVARALMGGTEGSLIDTYGGEWDYDLFRCILRGRLGTDTDVTIKYGKNLVDASKQTTTENIWTGVIPYWTSDETTVVYNGIIFSDHKDDFAYTMVIPLDASTNFEERPTQAQLRAYGQSYVRNNAKTSIPTSIDVSFVQLWQTEEYKEVAPMQRLRLGDSIAVQYPKLGINQKSRIVECDYNVLLDRYDSMTVGNVRANFVTSVQEDILHTEDSMTLKLAAELERAKNVITGASGGYFIINTDADGHPYETLWMNTDDKETATRVIRINYEGIAMGEGYNGPFNSAWLSMDGTFNAQYLNVINIDAGSVNTGVLESKNKSLQFDLDGGVLKVGNKALQVTAANFKLDEDGTLELTGKVTATSGKIGDCTIGDGIQYGKESIDDVSAGMYLGSDGFAVGNRGRYTGFMVAADGTPLTNYLAFMNDSGGRSRYGLWCDAEGRIASGGAIHVNTENQQTTWLYGNNIIDGYQKINSDRRQKKNIRHLTPEECTEFVMKLKPAEFEFLDEMQEEYEFYKGIRHGFIAQEVQEALGDEAAARSLVAGHSWDEYLELRYDELTADLVGICQKQQQRIDELEQWRKTIESLLEGDGK